MLCSHDKKDWVENQAGERIAWVCGRCGYKEACSPTPPPLPETPVCLRECEWCGKDYDPKKLPDFLNRFISKRFCSKACYEEDLEDRRETGRQLSGRKCVWCGGIIPSAEGVSRRTQYRLRRFCRSSCEKKYYKARQPLYRRCR